MVIDDSGCDKAAVGVSSNGNVIYDYDVMVESLMEKEGWSRDEAVDWVEFNIIGSLPHHSNPMPIVMFPLEVPED